MLAVALATGRRPRISQHPKRLLSGDNINEQRGIQMRRFLSLALSLGLVCAWGSAALAGDPIRDAIKRLQKGKKVQERVEAAGFLGGRNQAEVVEALAQALTDKEPSVREA